MYGHFTANKYYSHTHSEFYQHGSPYRESLKLAELVFCHFGQADILDSAEQNTYRIFAYNRGPIGLFVRVGTTRPTESLHLRFA